MSNRLAVTSADVTADIAVLDGSLKRVARGLGALEKDLPPGLYKVRVRVGPTVEERLVSLDRDQVLHFEERRFPSLVPLEGTSRTHEYQIRAAEEISSAPIATLGTGGSVFLFVREWTGESGAETAPAPGNPARGLFLRGWKADDAEIDIAAQASVRSDCDVSAGWSAEVDPGPYRLILRHEDGSSEERAIHVSRGFQTQVFMLMSERPFCTGGTCLPDIARGAVSLSRAGRFIPSERRTRMAELARFALTQNRPILSDAMLHELLGGKFADPMLGLYGAHLLLRDRPKDSAAFRIVFGNLVRLLGPGHPDVQALRLRFDGEDGPPIGPLRHPPMLRASWDLLCAASPGSAEVLEPDSPACAVSTRVLPRSPWLCWAGEGESDDRGQAMKDLIDDYLQTLAVRGKSSASILRELPLDTAPAGAARGLVMPAALGGGGGREPRSDEARQTDKIVSGWTPEIRRIVATSMGEEEKAELSGMLGLPEGVLNQLLAED